MPLSGITLALMSDRSKLYTVDACTRYCHDHGCHHDATLPDSLTSDDGLYGQMMRAFFDAGDHLAIGVDCLGGYALANVLVFCALVPLVHVILGCYSLYLAGR